MVFVFLTKKVFIADQNTKNMAIIMLSPSGHFDFWFNSNSVVKCVYSQTSNRIMLENAKIFMMNQTFMGNGGG